MWTSSLCLGDDCIESSLCSNGVCYCSWPLFYDEETKNCAKCPGLNESCKTSLCCSSTAMHCNSENICTCLNGIQNSINCSPSTPIYITASQIALSAALIMGMAALTMVIYRLCTKPRYLSARQRALATRVGLSEDSESLSYANYLRASLTSMQIRVLTRLRDRPPTYENGNSTQIPVQLPEAPPPYEGVTEGMPLPPAYTEIIISTSGYINSTFVDPDAEPVRRGADSDRNHNTIGSSTLQRNCDINNPSTDTPCDKDKVVKNIVVEKADTSDANHIPTT